MKIFKLFALVGTVLLINSCNTIAGVGEDVSAGGRALNKAAVDTQQKINQ